MQLFVATAVVCADFPRGSAHLRKRKGLALGTGPRSVSNQSSGLQNRLRTPIDEKYCW